MDVQYQRSTSKPRLHVCQPIIWSMAAILRDSTVVVAVLVVVRTRPRAIPLAMITMRKSTHGFPFVSHMSMGLRFGPPELRYKEHMRRRLGLKIS